MSSLHLTVAAIVEKRNRFLFVEELIQGREVLNQPAGHVEANETLLQAVIRETREETAWGFTPGAIIGVYLWTQPESLERFLRVVFSGKVEDHDARQQLDDGILRTLWLSREGLLERADALRSPMVLRAVDDYVAGTRFPVNMFQQIDVDVLADHAQLVR